MQAQLAQIGSAFAGLNFATLSCTDLSKEHSEVIAHEQIDAGCCSDGKSLCYQDLSMLCKNPSDFDGSGKWDKEDSESPDCSSVLV